MAANVAFNTLYNSQYNSLYRVKIHDYLGTFTAFERTMSCHNLHIETTGDDRDPIDRIKPCKAGLSFYCLDVYTRSFRDELFDSEEGRFYLEILEGGERIFFGRILSNGYSQADAPEPEITITAIDGLTTLKTIDYVHPNTGLATVKDILVKCLNGIDVITKFYSDTDKIIIHSTNLNNGLGDELLTTTLHYDYFYTFSNNTKKALSYYAVLEEMLKRYHLKLFYEDGYYYIFGVETPYTVTPTPIAFYKNGAQTTHTFSVSSIDLNSDANARTTAGGTFYYEPGYKKVRINVTNYHVNKNLADGLVWRRNTTTYQLINPTIGSTDYKSRMKINVNVSFTAADMLNLRYFRFRVYWKFDNGAGSIDYPKWVNTSVVSGVDEIIEGSTLAYPLTLINSASEDYTDIMIRHTTPKDYYIDWLFPQYADERELSCKIVFVGLYDGAYNVLSTPFSLVTFWSYTISQEVGIIPIEQTQEVYFESTNGSEYIEEKELSLLACDQYGNNLARAYLRSSVSDPVTLSDNEWQFAGDVDYLPLERLMTKSLLSIIGTKQMFFQGSYLRRSLRARFTDVVDYRSSFWMVGKYKWNILEEIIDITMIKTYTPLTDAVVGEDEPILIPETPNTDFIETIPTASPVPEIQYYEEFFDVAVNYVTLSTFIMEFQVNVDDEITNKTKWMIYINGVRQRYLNGTLVNRTFKFDVANDRIYFFKGAGNVAHIEVFKYY